MAGSMDKKLLVGHHGTWEMDASGLSRAFVGVTNGIVTSLQQRLDF